LNLRREKTVFVKKLKVNAKSYKFTKKDLKKFNKGKKYKVILVAKGGSKFMDSPPKTSSARKMK